MKLFTLLLSFLLCSQIYSLTNSFEGLQDSIQKPKTKIGVEFFVIPAYIYNGLSFGVSLKKTDRFEQVFKMGASFEAFLSKSFNYNLSSNSNFYFKNGKNYIPLWFKISNTRRNVGYEEGYYPHTLRFILGSGFGRVFTIGKKLQFRTEIGAGCALNLTNSKGDVFPILFNYSDYRFDSQYPEYNPKILPSFRLNFGFIFRS